MGGTGHWPVLSGYQPDRMTETNRTYGMLERAPRSVRQVAARHSQVGCATQYQLNRSVLVSRAARGSVLILLIAVFFGLGCRQSKPDQTRSK